MPIHRLFGLHLASDFPFATPLRGADGFPELSFSLCAEAPATTFWKQSSPIYRSPRKSGDGDSTALLYRAPHFEVLRFPPLLDFYLWRENGRIACQLKAPNHQFLAEIRFLGPVLAYWLEGSGLPVLHASAVAWGEQAAAFLSTHHGGKSGLAASLVQSGHSLLTDDLLPIEHRDRQFLARPGYPQMRMWPDEATHFLGHYEDLPLVHPDLAKRRVPIGPNGFGSFHDAPLPLGCLYLLERQPEGEAAIEICDVSPRDALIELLRHSFTPLLVEAAGLQPARFDLLSRLVLQVPVKRLRYPSGFDRLPRVAEAVRRDFERC